VFSGRDRSDRGGRRDRRELEPLSAWWEIVLVLICEAIVAVALLRELGCLSGGTGHTAFVCASDSAKPWYERSLAVAAAVAPLGAVLGHRHRSWRIVVSFVALSCVISAATLVWGLRDVNTGA
jgi:hypothetical protein